MEQWWLHITSSKPWLKYLPHLSDKSSQARVKCAPSRLPLSLFYICEEAMESREETMLMHRGRKRCYLFVNTTVGKLSHYLALSLVPACVLEYCEEVLLLLLRIWTGCENEEIMVATTAGNESDINQTSHHHSFPNSTNSVTCNNPSFRWVSCIIFSQYPSGKIHFPLTIPP